MCTYKFLVLCALAVAALSAPADESPQCAPSEKDNVELTNCCDTGEAGKTFDKTVSECLNLVKEKPDPASKKPPVPEGFECLDDCVMSKFDALGSDKKLDPAKLSKAAAGLFTAEWSAPATEAVKKCLAEATAGKGRCSSGADILWSCMERELYLQCPEKHWTKSTLCSANIERLNKCPKSPPYLRVVPDKA